MIRTPRRFAVLTTLTLACGAVAACVAPTSGELRAQAISTALTLQDHTGDELLPFMAGNVDPLQVVMGSSIGDAVLDAWKDVLTNPSASGSLGGGGIVDFGSTGQGGVAGAPTIQGGIANQPFATTGLPDSPAGSLGDLAAELCEFTAATCDRLLVCLGEDDVCSSLVSQSDCRMTFEDGLRERGATSVPPAVMAKLRCAHRRMNTLVCQESLEQTLATVLQSCR